ncbi:MAG: FKBP-type peptidyl-prolyl cis-trans isomerase [Mucilaginibacter sp.]|nr:FKBP-type peptidyl-prolyl cis-trans isomerase [Mucilaginibacter sp.]
MKKHLLILSLFLAVFASCSKNEDSFDAAAQAAKDEVDIQAYIKANPSINITKDANGVYYQVLTEGTGTAPTLTSTVSVNYVGKLLSGTQFDAGTGTTFPLANVIKGWQYGLTHVKAGGRIFLIVPSGLAYGNRSPGAGIPANSVLTFTIDLLTVK